MADFFTQQALRAVAVHSGSTSAPRAQSLEELSSGHLDVICAVDVFNEGLDLPELETIDILRGLVRHGARPRALEAFHEGYNPRAARAAHGSWLGFVGSQTHP